MLIILSMHCVIINNSRSNIYVPITVTVITHKSRNYKLEKISVTLPHMVVGTEVGI